VQAKIRITSASIEDLRTTFANRKALLPNEIELDILELAWISDQGMRALTDIVESRSASSLDAYSLLIHRYVSNINEYKTAFMAKGIQGTSSILTARQQ
jgi:hypothetical protein